MGSFRFAWVIRQRGGLLGRAAAMRGQEREAIRAACRSVNSFMKTWTGKSGNRIG
jgi:hypothetical protein